jgi:hypothetical protein
MLDVEELLTLDTMAQWLDAIDKDTSTDPPAIKVRRAKPRRAVDACWDKDATRIDEPFVYGNTASQCDKIFPVHSTPRMVAGGPLAADVLKCQLTPVARADYKVAFTDAEWQELLRLFPDGVCDYSKPGTNAVAPQGVYQRLPLGAPGASAQTSKTSDR